MGRIEYWSHPRKRDILNTDHDEEGLLEYGILYKEYLT